MSANERRAQFHRRNILESAKALFAEKGREQTTMDDIAQRADCSKSTVYVYFTSKDEIYDSIILEHFILLRDMSRAALEGKPAFQEGFRALCDVMVDFHRKYPAYFEGMMGKIALPGDAEDSVIREIYAVGEESIALIADFLRARSGGALPNIPPLQLAFTLWTAVCGIILFASNKEEYIQTAMGIDKERFMRDGFDTLLQSIENRRDA